MNPTDAPSHALAMQPPPHFPLQQVMGVESASAFAAATAKATVEARYLMAMRMPRNWDQVRSDMLKECSRPTFARNKSVWYRKPIGQGVEGFGIRFAEMAVRCMKNLMVESSLVFEDDHKEVHKVIVTDLESNVTYPQEFKVTKTVERSKPKDDGSFLSVRTNSAGKNTYTVEADDDDLLNKRGALLSKAIRTIALRIIPGDIQDECEDRIKQIRRDSAAQDPDGMRKLVADEFASINVSAVMLAEYLGHDLSQCSPTLLVELRDLYSAIAEGEASWKQAMENKAEGKAPPGRAPAGPEAWPADSFAKQLPRWSKAIAEGVKSADDIVAFARGKGALTPEQEAQIRAVKKAEVRTDEKPAAAPPTFSYDPPWEDDPEPAAQGAAK